MPGPVTNGLCLSARLEFRHGLIRYEVENVGDGPVVTVPDHMGADLEARREGEAAWTRLAGRPDAIRWLSGMGPTRKDLARLEPGASMPRDGLGDTIDQRRFAPAGTPRPGLEVPRSVETFTLDLLDFVWPDVLGDLDHGAVEVRVVQVHADWSDFLEDRTWIGRLPSATFRLALEEVPPAVRAEMDRGGD